jgi:hypothetical protein
MCARHVPNLASGRGGISLTLGVRGAEAKLQKEHTFGHRQPPSQTPSETPQILALADGAHKETAAPAFANFFQNACGV